VTKRVKSSAGTTPSRLSCIIRGVEVRLRVNPDAAWIVIRKSGTGPRYCDIPQDQVAAVVVELQGIGEDPRKFAAFVNARV
jgi:hypothetical protein